jgi:hypothetical protein
VAFTPIQLTLVLIWKSDKQGPYDFSDIFSVVLANKEPMGDFILMPEYGFYCSLPTLYVTCISIVSTVIILGTSAFVDIIIAVQYQTVVYDFNIRVHGFNALDENCEFFNDCNAMNNSFPEVTAVATTQETVTIITDTVAITSTITSVMLTTSEVNTVTIITSNDVTQTRTMFEESTSATTVTIIPEHRLHNHLKHDGSYLGNIKMKTKMVTMGKAS